MGQHELAVIKAKEIGILGGAALAAFCNGWDEAKKDGWINVRTQEPPKWENVLYVAADGHVSAGTFTDKIPLWLEWWMPAPVTPLPPPKSQRFTPGAGYFKNQHQHKDYESLEDSSEMV